MRYINSSLKAINGKRCVRLEVVAGWGQTIYNKQQYPFYYDWNATGQWGKKFVSYLCCQGAF